MSEEKKGFFSRLVEGLTKTRKNIMSGFDAIFSGFSSIDEDFYEELEEVLVMADLGIHTTENIIEELKKKVKEQHIKEPQACKQLLADTIKEQMRVDEDAYAFEHQTSVVLVIGVNGVGKTTTIGKLAGQYKKAGKKVVLAAADTFRAAAIEQLTDGRIEQASILLPARKVRILHPSFTMRLQQQKREKRMFCFVIQRDDCTIRRILWKNLKRSIVLLSGNIRRRIGRISLC